MAISKKCSFCGREVEIGKSTCANCGQYLKKTAGGVVDLKYGSSIKMSDLKAENTKRIQTGPWDYVFGDTLDDDGEIVCSGLAIGSSNLLGGEPGAGKSTLCLHIADYISSQCKDGEYVLIIATEENPVTTRSRAKRIGCENLDNIRIIDLAGGETTGCFEYIDGLTIKPKVVILDSTDGLVGDLVQEIKKLKDLAHNKNITMVLIHHLNKANTFTGRLDIQHDVDATFAITKLDEPKVRLGVVKNRNGKTGVKADFEMGEEGLIFLPEYEELKIGTLPSEEEFLERCEEEGLIVDGGEGEDLELENKEKVWHALNLTVKEWQKDHSAESLNLIEELLHFAGYTWSVK
jgi:predicted ATP-dependent serine protease